MAILNALASVAVKNVTSATQWYEEVLGEAPSRPMTELAEWTFKRGGVLQVYQLPERAGSGSFTLAVTDIDEQIAHLKKLGINTGDVMGGDRAKVIMITDPDGNHIAFAEAMDQSLAR